MYPERKPTKEIRFQNFSVGGINVGTQITFMFHVFSSVDPSQCFGRVINVLKVKPGEVFKK